MARYQVLIEYVGTSFRGWQIQKKGSTIQGLIQQYLSKLLIFNPKKRIKVEEALNHPYL